MPKPNVIMSHLSAQDAAKLRGVMSLTQAPLTERELQRLRSDVDVNNIVACAKRKGLDLSPFPLMVESTAGTRYFELGCWLYYYSRKVGSKGIWARIDCVRRLLLSDYTQCNPRYDFATVFDFGEREFDACFEMNDGAEVLRSLLGLRGIPVVDDKFASMGWSEEYLTARGYLEPPRAPQAPSQASSAVSGQADLFAAL